jgi:LysM repeat protein
MNSFLKITGLLLLVSGLAAANSAPADSVGTETKGGKRFVLHRVEQGQTLFSIGRRYNIAPEIIKAANAGLTDVRYDQTIRVPVADLPIQKTAKPIKATAPVIKSATVAPPRSASAQTTKMPSPKQQAREDNEAAKRIEKEVKKEGLHVVEAGQTLYSLSVRYGVLQADLRQWNGLATDNLQAGQTLIVSEQSYKKRQAAETTTISAPVPTKPAVVPVPKPEVPKSEPAKTAEEPAKPTPPKSTTPKSTVQTATPTPAEDSGTADATRPTTGRRIAETGLADVIDPTDQSPKLLALHRTAPVGSLVQVRNDSSNQTLWVKVIGRLPDTGLNDRVIVKLSARAFAKLSTGTQRFRAEVSYLVP